MRQTGDGTEIFIFLGTEGNDGIANSSPSATEIPLLFPSLMETDFSLCRSAPRQFFPTRKKYVATSIADSVIHCDGISKFRCQILSDERKSDICLLSPIPSLI